MGGGSFFGLPYLTTTFLPFSIIDLRCLYRCYLLMYVAGGVQQVQACRPDAVLTILVRLKPYI